MFGSILPVFKVRSTSGGSLLIRGLIGRMEDVLNAQPLGKFVEWCGSYAQDLHVREREVIPQR